MQAHHYLVASGNYLKSPILGEIVWVEICFANKVE
jgi:hypothetical protein